MTGGPTLGAEGQVLGPIRTLKNRGLLDLLHHLVEEVLPGDVVMQQGAGVRGPLVVSEPAGSSEPGSGGRITAGEPRWRCSFT